MKSIRAKTVVVGREKRPERWPLERARLNRIHQEQLKMEKANATLQYANGYRSGREDIVSDIATKSGWLEEFFREAGAELGKMAGSHIRESIERYDQVFQEKQRMADRMLTMASLSARPTEHIRHDDGMEIMTTVDIPPRHFHIASVLPIRVP